MFRSRLPNTAPPHTATNSEVVPELSELSRRLQHSGLWYLQFSEELEDAAACAMIQFTFAHELDLAGVPHPNDGYRIYIHEKEPARRVRPGTV